MRKIECGSTARNPLGGDHPRRLGFLCSVGPARGNDPIPALPSETAKDSAGPSLYAALRFQFVRLWATASERQETLAKANQFREHGSKKETAPAPPAMVSA